MDDHVWPTGSAGPHEAIIARLPRNFKCSGKGEIHSGTPQCDTKVRVIFVDRSRVRLDARWLKMAERERVKVVAHYRHRKVESRRYDFRPLWREVRLELEQLFHRKCAYCESRIEIES